MNEFNDIEANILLKNNEPKDYLMGLTPNEIHNLLYETYSDKSLIQFRNDIDDKTLDQIPLFRLAEEYLKIIQKDKFIKLTPLGALPKKVMVELYDKRFLLDDFIETGITKLWKEEDCISIMSMRYAIELTGLVKKVHGKITLTKKGIKFIEHENRLAFFKLFYQTFTDKFFWGFNDNYTEEPVGQLGWAYSAFMLHKYSDQERLTKFYAQKFAEAFPIVVTFFNPDYTTPLDHFKHCYQTRSFDRFFLWFGLIAVKKENSKKNYEENEYKKTELLDSIFVFDLK